jgi:hypothetical protein
MRYFTAEMSYVLPYVSRLEEPLVHSRAHLPLPLPQQDTARSVEWWYRLYEACRDFLVAIRHERAALLT